MRVKKRPSKFFSRPSALKKDRVATKKPKFTKRPFKKHHHPLNNKKSAFRPSPCPAAMICVQSKVKFLKQRTEEKQYTSKSTSTFLYFHDWFVKKYLISENFCSLMGTASKKPLDISPKDRLYMGVPLMVSPCFLNQDELLFFDNLWGLSYIIHFFYL